MIPRNPIQPFVIDDKGVVRFKENAIVRTLMDYARKGKKLDLNDIAGMEFSQDDECQFAQLIGYSLGGYHELHYVSDEHAQEATAEAIKIHPDAGGCRDQECNIHCGVRRAPTGEPTPDEPDEDDDDEYEDDEDEKE
jgi:hypothetical protein